MGYVLYFCCELGGANLLIVLSRGSEYFDEVELVYVSGKFPVVFKHIKLLKLHDKRHMGQHPMTVKSPYPCHNFSNFGELDWRALVKDLSI